MSHPDSPPSRLERWGRALFRVRGLTPVPLGVVAMSLSWRSHVVPAVSPRVDAALNVAGVALGIVGLVVRFVTVGLSPQINGQAKAVGASTLQTAGLYQVLRHPLYLGNALMVTGLLLVVARWEAVAVAVPAFVMTYGLIIIAEERALAARFGPHYEAWARAVGHLPRPSRLAGLHGPFAWRLALHREVTAVSSFGLTLVVLLAWEWAVRAELTYARWSALRAAAIALAALLVAVKAWRKLKPVT